MLMHDPIATGVSGLLSKLRKKEGMKLRGHREVGMDLGRVKGGSVCVAGRGEYN